MTFGSYVNCLWSNIEGSRSQSYSSEEGRRTLLNIGPSHCSSCLPGICHYKAAVDKHHQPVSTRQYKTYKHKQTATIFHWCYDNNSIYIPIQSARNFKIEMSLVLKDSIQQYLWQKNLGMDSLSTIPDHYSLKYQLSEKNIAEMSCNMNPVYYCRRSFSLVCAKLLSPPTLHVQLTDRAGQRNLQQLMNKSLCTIKFIFNFRLQPYTTVSTCS